MPGPETIETYLETVQAQIRWKRARPVVLRELRTHLEDQRADFLAEGKDETEAERLAVTEMGDPAAVGVELDRLHRPKPQWGMLGITLILLLTGCWLRMWLTQSGAVWGLAIDPVRCALTAAMGGAALAGMYFLDVSRLLACAKAVYLGAVLLGCLSLWLSPDVNNVSYYTRYVALFYPVVYALWLYACRGEGRRHLLSAAAGGVPLALICLAAPFTQGLLLLGVTGGVLLLAAIRLGWYGTPRKRDSAAVCGLLLLLAGGLAWKVFGGADGRERLQILLHPETDAAGAGFQGAMTRRVLDASQWVGQGDWQALGSRYPLERTLPEWNFDFFPTTMVYKLGWLPYLLVVLALAGLLCWMVRRCLRQRDWAAGLLALAALLPLGLQTVFAVMLNLGFVAFSAQIPLLTGNLHSIVDCALLGAALSVFRSETILRDTAPPACGWAGA